MKKILLLTISILIVTAAFARRGNPIPSYNVPVSNNAYFQESISISLNGGVPDEKRDMNVSNDGSAGNGNSPVTGENGLPAAGDEIIVKIFSATENIILGPYVIPAGKTLNVQIDGSNWGVIVSTKSPTYVSVWTNDKP
jgi:hypothetical protein